MTYKERAIQLLDQIPESKMDYVIGFLEGAAIPDKLPNDETLAAFAELDTMKTMNAGQHFNGTTEEFFNMLLEDD